MKKLIYTLSAIIVVLTVFCSFLLVKKEVVAGTVIEPCEKFNKKDSKDGDFKSIFYDNYCSVIMPNDGRIINAEANIQDTTFRKSNVLEHLKAPKMLIFRYSFSDCEGCIELVLEELSKLKNDIPFLIITDSYSDQDFLIKMRQMNPKCQVYSLVGSESLNLPLEGKALPFLFLVDQQGRTSHIFTPYKEYPLQLKEYLSVISPIIR